MAVTQSRALGAPPAHHFSALDGIRGLGVLMVVIYHGFYINPHDSFLLKIANSFRDTWFVGVQILFSLSGFLIARPFFQLKWNGSQQVVAHAYARNRIARIVPPLYLSIAFFILMYLALGKSWEYVDAGILWASGLRHFVKDPTPFNNVYWSLFVEIDFYCLLPLLFLLFRRISFEWTVVGIMAILLLPTALLRQYIAAVPNADIPWGFYIGWFSAFSGGILFAAFYTVLPIREPRLVRLAPLGWLGFLVYALWGALTVFWKDFYGTSDANQWTGEFAQLCYLLAGFFMLFVVFDPSAFLARIFQTRLLRWLGGVSYEWYLFHYPFYVVAREHYGAAGGSALVYLMRTLVPMHGSLLLSALIHRFFSMPLMNWIKNSGPVKTRLTSVVSQ